MIARVLARRRALEVAGPARVELSNSSGARRLARVRERLARILEHAPALARPVLAERHEDLMRNLTRGLESAREERIDDLLRADLPDGAFARRLGALLQDRLQRVTVGAATTQARPATHTVPLLLLRRVSAPTAAPAAAPP